MGTSRSREDFHSTNFQNPLDRLRKCVQRRVSRGYEANLPGIAEYMLKTRNVVTLAGSGMSDGSWLADMKASMSELKTPSFDTMRLIFDANHFRQNPDPLYRLAKRVLLTPQGEPSLAHYFIRLLHEKGLLLRHFTENMDELVLKAGVPEEKVVQANGSFNTWRCCKCRQEHPKLWIEATLSVDERPECLKCGALVRPDMVFFGEPLPRKFFQNLQEVMSACDLLLILGTNLDTEPFSCLLEMTRKETPRLVIHTRVMCDSLPLEFGARDVFLGQDPSEGCLRLSQYLGWEEDLLTFKSVSKDNFFFSNSYTAL